MPRPIDAFFDSLGAALGEQSVGIVLSGTGSDGALGLKAIKECGGLTIAQGSDGTAPQYGEMPAGAIATGSVDLVAPIEDIPGHLLRIKGIVPPITKRTRTAPRTSMRVRLKICAILRAQSAMISAVIAIRLSFVECSGACRWSAPRPWMTTSARLQKRP